MISVTNCKWRLSLEVFSNHESIFTVLLRQRRPDATELYPSLKYAGAPDSQRARRDSYRRTLTRFVGGTRSTLTKYSQP